MAKNPHAVALGHLGGLKGGKSRTRAKLKAVRKNLAKARQHLRTERLCGVCHREPLYLRNKSGICRKCQRARKTS